KGGCGNAESDVIGSLGRDKVRLRQGGGAVAGTGIGPAGNREDGFDSPIRSILVDGAVGVKEKREAHFQSRAIDRNEARHDVARGSRIGGLVELVLGIDQSAAS